jgi:predicted nucleotidyltransferase
MDKHTVIAKLRQHQAELRDAGVLHLRLHGSLARDQFHPTSDVDLIADLDASSRLTLIDMASLEHYLADLLGVPVILSPALISLLHSLFSGPAMKNLQGNHIEESRQRSHDQSEEYE